MQRIGIVGFGMRAHLGEVAERVGENAKIVVICDTSERGRHDAAKAHPDALVTASLDEFQAQNLDAALVTTPDFAHAAVAIPLLEAGIPVFLEKPIAITIEDADRILETAKRTGTRIYVGHNMRHMPVITQMRDLIQAGRIGDVKAVWCRHFVGAGGDYYFKDWHADRSKATSLLLQKGAHDIDVIHWLAGAYTDRVHGMGDLAVYGDIAERKERSDERMGEWASNDNWPPAEIGAVNPVVDVEDISQLNMRLENGVLANYEQCHFTPDYWRNYTVIGTRGRIENFGNSEGEEIAVYDTRRSGRGEPDEVIEIASGIGSHGGADELLMAEFLRFAAKGGETATSPVAARQAVAVGCLGADSIRGEQQAFDVPPLDAELVNYFARGQV